MKHLILCAICLSTLFNFAQNAKIDSLTVRLAYQNQDSTKVETSLLLINELYAIEDYNKALLFIDQTSELSKSLNYNKGLAQSNFIKGLIYDQRKETSKAINNFELAKTYFQKINDTLNIARVNNNLGTIEIKRGNYKIGLRNALSAIQIFEEKSLNEELKKAYGNLSEAYLQTEKYDKALEYNKKALRINEQLDDLNGMKIALKNLGDLYALQQDHIRSIDSYERMLTLLDAETDKDLKGEILSSLGKSYLATDKFDDAADYLSQGLTYNRQRKNKEGILMTLNALGDLNIKQRRLKRAENQLWEAYKLSKEINNREELLYNLKLNTKLDSTRNFFEDAFNWQNQYYALKNELDKEKEEASVSAYPIKEDPEPEVPALIENKPIAEDLNAKPETALTKNQQLILYGLIAGLVFLLVLLIFSYLKSSKDTKTIKSLSKSNKELTQRNAQLEEVNQVKDKLFSIVSHDLKDSISSIKAFLDLLKDDGISKEEFNELIPELSENANNASSLLFNLLNWSKSQMQNLQPKPELFNIQEVFHIKMSLIEKKVEDKGIILIDESRREFVYADRSMLEIVIQNLITNAVKFTGKGDVITISNQDYNGKVLICVEDTGIGISEENIKKLFNAKKNFTTIGTENEKGTGLGLTICKDLVELNKGRIWVESTPNIGSKFFIELPKEPLSS